jgi:hypothetical protein
MLIGRGIVFLSNRKQQSILQDALKNRKAKTPDGIASQNTSFLFSDSRR